MAGLEKNIIKIGRNFGLTIPKDIINGLDLKAGDKFHLEVYPLSGEIIIKLHKKECKTAKYKENIIKKSRIKNIQKSLFSKVWIRLYLADEDEIREDVLDWLPDEIIILKKLLNKRGIDKFTKSKIRKILQINGEHKTAHDSLTDRGNQST